MGRGEDTWNWGEEPNGKFSIRSAYRLTLELDLQNSDPDWKCIWRWRGPTVATEWDPGPEGWVTVNTDGSVVQPSGNASASGLIRDHLGHCSLAFSANLGRCSITRAELRDILHGLEFSWSSGHKKVRLQTDSQSAASLILAEDPPLHQHASEVIAIRELLQRNWQVEIHHIFREGNGAADFLANMGHCFDPGIQIVPPSDCNLGYFLRKD
ncbi:Putative ribonuclease H protein At1g65750 [Linum perenne]